MKHYLISLSILVCFLMGSCKFNSDSTLKVIEIPEERTTNNVKQDSLNYPVFSVSQTVFDMGNIGAEKEIMHAFKFKNAGSKTLLIKDVKPSCGCTVVDFPRIPIQPGDSGIITAHVKVDKSEKTATKILRVISNTNPKRSDLYLKFEANNLVN